MNQKILGDKKRVRYDEGLIDVVNQKYRNTQVESEESEYPAPVQFQKIIFEPTALRDPFSYDKSFDALRKRGIAGKECARFPTPKEIFDFLNYCISSTKGLQEVEVVKDMLDSSPEWTSCAVMYDGENLGVGLYPGSSDLYYHSLERDYLTSGLPPGRETKNFRIGGNLSNRFIEAKELPPELGVFLYGNNISDISLFNKPGITIPHEHNRWYPVARMGYNLSSSIIYAGSRGVVVNE